MKTLDRIKSSKAVAMAVLVLLLTAAGLLAVVLRGGAEAQQEAHTAEGVPPPSAPAKSGLAAADRDGDGVVYQSGMHPWIVEDEPGQCPICGMDLMPVSVEGVEEGTVRIDPVTLQNIGVRTATVAVEPLGREVRTTGRFVMDEQGERTVSLKIGGWVEKLHADYEGAFVRKGQPLLELYSPELVSTQEEYLLALRNARRLKGSPAAQDAERLLEAARRRLAYWDLSEAQIRGLEETGEVRRTLTFYAPSSGEVMRKQVTEGQHVQAGQPLMDIVDLSRIWLIADVYEQDLAWVEVGTPARIELPYDPGQVYNGRVSYLYHMLDEETRAAKARIVLPGGHNVPLKPGMYATVHLVSRETEPVPVVPAEAVIRTGEEEIVLLALGEGRFMPAEVTTGVETGGKVQILEGLQGGEEVVTSAQFLIDSEARLQSAIGAMQGGHDHSMSATDAGGTPRPAAQGPDGTQVVRITVGPAGFEPERIVLEAGVPARLVFTRHAEAACAEQVQSPALGIQKTDLPMHEPVAIEVTPEEHGTFSFVCGMDMLEGTILVRS